MKAAGGLIDAIFHSGWTYVAFGLWVLSGIKRMQRRTAGAVGKVTTRARWWEEDPQVKVEFRAYSGELVTFSTDQRRYQVGDSVDVMYDPADCKNAAVKGRPSQPVIAVGFSVLLILCGLGWEVFRWLR